MALMIQVKGLQIRIKILIGWINVTAIFSGAIIAIRLGIKSAKMIKREVTNENDKVNPIVSAHSP